MSRVTPELRIFASRIVAFDKKENESSENKMPGGCLASEKLRPHLATLMGSIGFNALLTRSLTLAKADVSWLSAVHVRADGTFEGFEGLERRVDPVEFFEGCVILLAHLLGLLIAFIGEDLTFRLVREGWPTLRPRELDFARGEKK